MITGCAITTENGEFTTDLISAISAINKELKDNGLQELPMPEQKAEDMAQLNYSLGDIEVILTAGELSGNLKKIRFLDNTHKYVASDTRSEKRMLEYIKCFIKVLDRDADIDKISKELEFQNLEKSGSRETNTKYCKYSFSVGTGARFVMEAK